MTMTNDTRQAHLAYLAKSFVVAHEIAEGLGPEGTATLRKYGCWYEALDKGNLSAISESQRHFLDAVHGKTNPTTEHELIWVKYKKLWAQALMHATAGGKYSRAHGHFGDTNSSKYNL